MKLESDPITDDEWLLRRVRFDRFRTKKTPYVSPGAFEPRTKGDDIDGDGISLYRNSCLESPDEVLATINVGRWPEYGIVRVSIVLIKALGLTVKSMPDNRVCGHVVIPELNAETFLKEKGDCKPKMFRLAELASEPESIVRTPPMLQDNP